jgi:hypothetical protein
MKECIRNWVSSLQRNPSVLLLVQSQEVQVCFDSRHEKVHVLFLNGKVELITDKHEHLSEVIITGDHESFEKLLKGHLSLRKMVIHQQITVQASFRKTLLLESIFQLAHPQFLSEISINSLTTPKIM